MAKICEVCKNLFANLTWYDNNDGDGNNFLPHQLKPSKVQESADQGCRICSALQEQIEADALTGQTCDEQPIRYYFSSCNMYPVEDGFLLNFYLHYSTSNQAGLVQFKVIPALG